MSTPPLFLPQLSEKIANVPLRARREADPARLPNEDYRRGNIRKEDKWDQNGIK